MDEWQAMILAGLADSGSYIQCLRNFEFYPAERQWRCICIVCVNIHEFVLRIATLWKMIHWKGHLGVGLEKWNINGRKEDQLSNHCNNWGKRWGSELEYKESREDEIDKLFGR